MKSARCLLGWTFCVLSLTGLSQEICTNGKDDDGDGLTDLKDPDCQCHYTVTNNLLQNGSFESFLHCPTYLYDNDYNIISQWRYGTFTNQNEANYYHNLRCAYDSGLVMTYIPPARPLPNGEAFVSIRQAVYRKPGFQETDIAKTYISQCLQNPLNAGEQYTLSFSAGRFQSNDDPDFKYKTEPFTVAIFGHTDCSAVPFGQRNVNSNGCPLNSNGWTMLGNITVQSKGKWVQNKIKFTAPPGITVVAIGPDCSLLNPDTELADSTTRSDYYVYYLDDVHLLKANEFPFSYVQTVGGNPCADDPVLVAPLLPNAAFQWYKDSVAIAGAWQREYRVPANETGHFNVRVANSDTCFVSEPFFIGATRLSQLHFPGDTTFCKGEELVLMHPATNLTYSWNGHFDSTVTIREQGRYDIIASDANGCNRTFTVHVQEEDCNNNSFYMPNAFTPNDDGKNDVFRIPERSLASLQEFSVYDRWGERVFNTTDKRISWNGYRNGKRCAAGTYAYFIRGIRNNKGLEVKGTVTLVR